jgi:hypothetical protein
LRCFTRLSLGSLRTTGSAMLVRAFSLLSVISVLALTMFLACPSGHASSPQVAQAKKVLDPMQFAGEVQLGYASAQKYPEIMEQLFCYCGCDVIDKHSSLLDCFVNEHSVDCQVCRDEAILAARLKGNGKSIAEIQQAVDKQFSKEYLYQNPSVQLIRYRGKVLGIQSANPASGSENRLKPGATRGTCCGNSKSQEHRDTDHPK